MNPTLLAHVDPEALCHRVPLADEDNAIGPWKEALKALTPVEENPASCDTACCGVAPAIPSLNLPDDAWGKACRENVAANRRSLELIDVGIDRGMFQFPEPGPDDNAADMEFVFGLRQLVRLRHHYVRVLATDAQLVAAGSELLRSLKMADMVFHGDGHVVHFLIAIALKGIVLAGCEAFAFSPAATTQTLTEILVALERDTELNALMARSKRLEFQSRSLPIFERLAAAGTLDATVDALLENYFSLAPLPLAEKDAADAVVDDRNAWRRGQIMHMLDGHPAPFDLGQTVRMASEAIVATIRDFEPGPSGSTLRKATPREGMLSESVWPSHLRPLVPYECIGNSPAARRYREELGMSAEMLADLEPPSDAAIELARQKLREISNPIGRLLVEDDGEIVSPFSVGRLPAEEIATKVILAIRLYFDRFWRLPSELGELVDTGLLPHVPIDPFDGQPLRYSCERGLIWSVGLDQADGNGDPAGDFVWRVPQLLPPMRANSFDEQFPTGLNPVVFRGSAGESATVRPVSFNSGGGLWYGVEVVMDTVTMSTHGFTDIDAFLRLRDDLEQLLLGEPVEPGMGDDDGQIHFGLHRSNDMVFLKGDMWPWESQGIPNRHELGGAAPRNVSFSIAIPVQNVSGAVEQLSEIVRYIERRKKRRGD